MAHPSGPLSREELASLRDGHSLPPHAPPVLRSRARELDRWFAPQLRAIRDLPEATDEEETGR